MLPIAPYPSAMVAFRANILAESIAALSMIRAIELTFS
jgi:hypothetical protein